MSAIYLDVINRGGVLMDCGESTLSQLHLRYTVEQMHQVTPHPLCGEACEVGSSQSLLRAWDTYVRAALAQNLDALALIPPGLTATSSCAAGFDWHWRSLGQDTSRIKKWRFALHRPM